jgi:hypothetical protein
VVGVRAWLTAQTSGWIEARGEIAEHIFANRASSAATK